MRTILSVILLALLLAACGSATTTAPSAQQPTAAMAEQPTAAMAEKPTAAMAEQPTAAMAEEPTAAMAEQPTAAMAEQPTAAMAEQPTAAMAEQPALPADARTVPLKYIAGLSNTGPKDATGSLTLLPNSNTIIVDVKGLPQVAGTVYEIWLLPAADSGGRFNTNADGTGHFEQKLTGNLKDYNQIVLTIEPEPDNSPKPASEHSIGSDKF